jgi:hypothetical protein
MDEDEDEVKPPASDQATAPALFIKSPALVGVNGAIQASRFSVRPVTSSANPVAVGFSYGCTIRQVSGLGSSTCFELQIESCTTHYFYLFISNSSTI